MCAASSASRTCGARASASLYTATDAMPSSRHARMMRRAISPRLAIRILLNIRLPSRRESQRQVSVLLGRIAIALRSQCFQRVDQSRACVARVDDVVEIAATGGDVRVRELLPIFLDLRVSGALRIVALVDLFA